MPHIEVLQQANTAGGPGWAYVYDRAIDPSKVAIDPTSGARGATKGGRAQRAAAQQNVASSELSRREQVAVARRLADLERDGGSGKEVPVPSRWKDFVVGAEGGGVGTWGKGRKGGSQATRKILQSEKNFGHYLDDEEADIAMGRGMGAAGGGMAVTGRRADYGVKRGSIAGKRASISEAVDVEMDDAPLDGEKEDEGQEVVKVDPDAENPFFKVSVPVALSEAELEELLSQPPLSYNAARAAPPRADAPPQRKFCEVCGYWGRVKCLKCGSRVCGLDCKETHDQECRRRFA